MGNELTSYKTLRLRPPLPEAEVKRRAKELHAREPAFEHRDCRRGHHLLGPGADYATLSYSHESKPLVSSVNTPSDDLDGI